MNNENLAQYIDHTILKADAVEADIASVCAEAREHGFCSVCVNSSWIPFVREQLSGSGVKACSTIGFPLGAMAPEVKAFEAATAVRLGAQEIDMVINIGWLKDGRYDDVEAEIRAVKGAAGNVLLKVIIETCYLTDEQKAEACRRAVKAGAEYVKTSTGFGSGGAVAEDLQLMLDTVAGKALVKASGGVRDAETARKFVDMGVRRLGTSSGVKIVQGGAAEGTY